MFIGLNAILDVNELAIEFGGDRAGLAVLGEDVAMTRFGIINQGKLVEEVSMSEP